TQQTPTGTNTSGQPSTGATRGTIRLNPRQDAFTQYMNVGYAATDQRDYQTALINFRRALNERPGNPYAVRAIQNVESYIQRQQSR
ncbi:MAG TPA: hypothetical protein DCL61_20295, partial [Cyanobacteria bacterium UBA12227]|nr:hypothetical protein [Cyanobacteria bacterium UBA12227]HAX89541.1 hypothetical protein [Cyanobacteria bacterium UBA11370]HBY79136.1 hypothetical protein [Cyanobacteria bacterium UBA11148]